MNMDRAERHDGAGQGPESARPVEALSKSRLRLWLRLLKTSKWIESELRERLREEFDTTLPRFDVMAALYRNESGLRMSELSGVLRVSNGNVTGIVDRLVADGLLLRVPVDNDRRAMLVRLTGTGRERFATMAKRHEEWIDDMLGGLELSEIEAVSGGLGGILRRLEAGGGRP